MAEGGTPGVKVRPADPWSRQTWVRRKSIKTPSHVATISLGLYEGPLLTIIHVYRGVKTGSKSTFQHIKQGSISLSPWHKIFMITRILRVCEEHSLDT